MTAYRYALATGLATLLSAQAHAFSITSATLTGPASLCVSCPPGGSATFTVSLVGEGWDPGYEWLRYSVFDSDALIDSELVGETLFHIAGTSTPNGHWEKSITFDLYCDVASGCKVRGTSGSSGETAPEVYALIEADWGSDLATSNKLKVSCPPIPEPAPMALLIAGLATVPFTGRLRQARTRHH